MISYVKCQCFETRFEKYNMLALKVKASPGLEANLLSTRATEICAENIPRQKV